VAVQAATALVLEFFSEAPPQIEPITVSFAWAGRRDHA